MTQNTMERKYNILKCICYDTTFEQMKKIMKEKNINSIEELKEIKLVASNCKLCLPYIKKMIETGQTEFDIILD